MRSSHYVKNFSTLDSTLEPQPFYGTFNNNNNNNTSLHHRCPISGGSSPVEDSSHPNLKTSPHLLHPFRSSPTQRMLSTVPHVPIAYHVNPGRLGGHVGVFCQKTESAVGAYLSTSIGRQDRPCYGASMRKSSVLLITIAVCLTSASPSYAKKITYSNGIQTQSALPTKADKVKCGTYHSPLVKVPKFKLVKQTCQDLYSGASSMEFKAE